MVTLVIAILGHGFNSLIERPKYILIPIVIAKPMMLVLILVVSTSMKVLDKEWTEYIYS